MGDPSRDAIQWLGMRLVEGLRKSKDVSQPVNLWSVHLSWLVKCLRTVVYLWQDGRKSYAARVDIFPGFLL